MNNKIETDIYEIDSAKELMFKKKLNFKKIGLIIKPQVQYDWFTTHAMVPTPEDLGNGIFKIYFSGRNKKNQSFISWAKVSLNETFKVIEYSQKPVLSPGNLGCFDDNGVTPSCVINLKKNEKALYYIGWNPGSTVRVHLFGGLAISKNDMNFSRWSKAPIIERTKSDPYLNTAPWVVCTEGGYRMYYVSGVGWKHKNLPKYNIKLAFSQDGKNWQRKGYVCIDFKNKEETALARPYVIFDKNIWKMWFSYKGDNYKIGYAESYDGIEWIRKDDFFKISSSKKDTFDNEMMCYAAVVKYNEKYFMFYNGNNYGFHGINLAVAEK